jgi:hypothetical protein
MMPSIPTTIVLVTSLSSLGYRKLKHEAIPAGLYPPRSFPARQLLTRTFPAKPLPAQPVPAQPVLAQPGGPFPAPGDWHVAAL